MPTIRAIGQNLIPLRRPQFVCPGENRATVNRFNRTFESLLDFHQACHIDEPYLPHFTFSPKPCVQSVGYEFFREFVAVAIVRNTKVDGFVGGIADNAKSLRISDVAAEHLENVFGQAYANPEYAFILDGSMPECVNKGNIFWDVENERIIVKTHEGFTLAFEGTNVVEAAVYLPRIYKALKDKVFQEGIRIIEVKAGDGSTPLDQREQWAVAASPVVGKLWVPNLKDPVKIDQSAEQTVQNAYANYLSRNG